MDLPFECSYGCGRKFADEEKLSEHIDRRHQQQEQGQTFKKVESSASSKIATNSKRLLHPKLPSIPKAPIIANPEDTVPN
jgi:hypothetical protein